MNLKQGNLDIKKAPCIGCLSQLLNFGYKKTALIMKAVNHFDYITGHKAIATLNLTH